MNRSFAKLLSLAAVACASTCLLFADDVTPVPAPPQPNPADVGFGGLQTSLTTGGYRFVIADTPLVPSPAGAPIVVPDTFPACASLQNRSPFEIKFTFPNSAAAELKFRFRVFDSAGTLVWQSDTESAEPPVETTVALGKFQRWKLIAPIPLKPGGKALEAGIYTLEALINADKQVGVSTVFEVVAATPPSDPTKTGLRGLVVKADNVPVAGTTPTESAAAGALVVINEIVKANESVARQPFTWSGKADALGKFKASAPAGRYRVTANYVAPATAKGAAQPLVYSPKTVEVEVVDQKLADITIHVDTAKTARR